MSNHKFSPDFEQVSAIFSADSDIDGLLDDLYGRNLSDDDISILMNENTRSEFFSAKESTKAPEGATIGGLTGGVLGAVIGGLTLVGSIVLPGAGLLAVGPIVGVLTGGLVGTAAGGLIGALAGAGIPEHEAKFYEDALKQNGNILVVAHVTKDYEKEIRALFERYGAHQIKVHH